MTPERTAYQMQVLRIIKKADIILIIFFIIFGLAGSYYISRTSASQGKSAVITVDGKEFGTYDLSKDRTIDLKTGNVLSVKDGCIRMVKADCHGQDCIRQGKISRPSQTIVCLPHKVIVEIKGGEDEYDTISQ